MKKEKKLYNKLESKYTADKIGVYILCDPWFNGYHSIHSTIEYIEYIQTRNRVYFYTPWDNSYGVVYGDLFDFEKEINSTYDVDGWEN